MKAHSLIICCFPVVLVMAPLLWAEDVHHQALRKYLDAEVFAVGWVDLRAADVAELARFLREIDGPPLDDRQRERLKSIRQALVEMEVTHAYFVIDAANLARGPEAAVLPTPKAKATALLLRSLEGPESYVTVEDGDVVLTGDAQQVAALQSPRGEPSALLLEAIRAAEGPHAVAAAVPPEWMTSGLRYAGKLWDEQPAKLAEAAKAIASVRWISLSGQLPPRQITLRLETDSDESARGLAEVANRFVTARLGEDAHLLRFTQDGSSVQLAANSLDQAAAQLKTIQRLTTRPALTSNNMKQIALALHNFHDVYSHFPPQSLVDKNGKRLLSWRVLILPYLEEQALYDRFRLNEPWDSPHNLQLAREIPAAFAMQKSSRTDESHTQIVAGLTDRSAFGRPGSPLRALDVKDGLSNTIWFVETAPEKAVVWTSPEDLVVDTASPFASLVSADAKGFWCSFVDGSVRWFSQAISAETLNALVTIDAGERIDHEDLK